MRGRCLEGEAGGASAGRHWQSGGSSVSSGYEHGVDAQGKDAVAAELAGQAVGVEGERGRGQQPQAAGVRQRLRPEGEFVGDQRLVPGVALGREAGVERAQRIARRVSGPQVRVHAMLKIH